MREKYLKKLLELLAEMQADYKANKLDDWSRALYWLLQKVLVAFWFFQIDMLHSHVCEFKLMMNMPLVEDAGFMAKEFVDALDKEMTAATTNDLGFAE